MALIGMITCSCETAVITQGAVMVTTRTKAASVVTFSFYRTMFRDSMEAENKAPRTIETYGLSVDQLGAFVAERGMPTDPTKLTREHLIEWMRYLQRPVE